MVKKLKPYQIKAKKKRFERLRKLGSAVGRGTKRFAVGVGREAKSIAKETPGAFVKAGRSVGIRRKNLVRGYSPGIRRAIGLGNGKISKSKSKFIIKKKGNKIIIIQKPKNKKKKRKSSSYSATGDGFGFGGF